MYSMMINQQYPACLIVLVDQSQAMSMRSGAQPDQAKSPVAAAAINDLLTMLCFLCSGSNGVRSYFQVGVVGYGRTVQSTWGGDLVGRELVSITEIFEHPLQFKSRQELIDDENGETVPVQLEYPVWIEPVADGTAPLAEAFSLASAWITSFLAKHNESFPPIVINLTGGSSDSDPTAAAKAMMQLASQDGEVLLFNISLSSRGDTPIIFPESEQGLPDDFSKQLFRISSPIPANLIATFHNANLPASANSRGFVENADLNSLIQLLKNPPARSSRYLR